MRQTDWQRIGRLPAFVRAVFACLACGLTLTWGLASCAQVSVAAGQASATPTAAATSTPSPSVTPSVTLTHSPTLTFTPTITSTPSPQTPTPSATPTWVYVAAGQKVTVPILMYHHVSDANSGARYSVTIDNFRGQMELLKANGFTTITTLELANVLWEGGALPARPVVITFDDGHQNVYDNAFPILNQLGFRAAMYVVANRLQTPNFVHATELSSLIAAGWEVGSHSMTHANLSEPELGLNMEMYQSRLSLSGDLGVEVLTFAYPYTIANPLIFRKAAAYGYRAAVCAGSTNEQSLGNVYCLSRREVKGDMSLEDFSRLVGLTKTP